MSKNVQPDHIMTNIVQTADGSVVSVKQIPLLETPTDIVGAWFQPPYTTVRWMDGTTTTVKCDAEDAYNPKTGVLLCFAKRLFAGGKYNDALKKALGMVPDLSHEVLRTMTLDDGSVLNVYGDGTMDVKSFSIKPFLYANPSIKAGITIQAGAR